MKKNLITLISLGIIFLGTSLGAQERNHKSKDGVGIVAHRGFWKSEMGENSQNSIASLKAAQEAGFWGSEFDVNMTKDGVLIVYHDNKINGKPIDQYNHSEFKDVKLPNGESIPTIDEYLLQGKKNPHTVLVYELKSRSTKELEDQLVDKTIKKLKEHKLLSPKKVIFIAFSRNICDRLADKLSKKFTIQYLGNKYTPKELNETGINGIDLNYKTFYKNPEWVKEAHELDMTTNSWTLNAKEDIEKIVDMGIDFVTSDYPLLVREILNTEKCGCSGCGCKH